MADKDETQKLEAVFEFEKDTKNTRRYAEVLGDGLPIVNTIYIQQWALRQLNGELPERVRVVITVEGG